MLVSSLVGIVFALLSLWLVTGSQPTLSVASQALISMGQAMLFTLVISFMA
eukprot:m.19305 g.19305  ORF g.19305 m.19305 type:complete len:51 (-) comp5914_c0_seq1:111-263(-)